jgi:gliding motility-associated-like protein
MTVNPLLTPSLSITADNTTICPGGTVNFTATPVNGGTTPQFSWTVNGTAVTGANQSTFSTSSLNDGDVVCASLISSETCVTSANANSNCISIVVTGTALTPTINIIASDVDICEGELVSFQANVMDAGSNPGIQWQINGINQPGGVGPVFSFTFTSTSTVTAVLTPNDPCAPPTPVNSNNLTINVTPLSTINASVGSNATVICNGDSVALTAIVSGAGTNFVVQWLQNGLTIPGATGNTYNSGALIGPNTFSITVTSTLACLTNNPVTSFPITVNALPVGAPTVSITGTQTICANSGGTFSATVNQFAGQAPTFQWTLNGSNAGTNSPFFSASGFSNNDVIQCSIVSDYLCAVPNNASSNSITLTVLPAPVIDAGTDKLIAPGGSTTLTATGEASWVYQWSPAEGLSCTDCLNPLAGPDANTTYVLTAIDPSTGCSATDSVFVEITDETSIFVPSAFSPNGDSFNNQLFVRGIGIREFNFAVYNRYGEKVFETSDQQVGWDGTFRGMKVNNGVFVYVLTGVYRTGEAFDLKGNVSLLR